MYSTELGNKPLTFQKHIFQVKSPCSGERNLQKDDELAILVSCTILICMQQIRVIVVENLGTRAILTHLDEDHTQLEPSFELGEIWYAGDKPPQ